MKHQHKPSFFAAICLLGAFVLWTVAVRTVDVQPIGPLGTSVGFAALNRYVHSLTGVHMGLYTLTDWLGLLPLGVGAGFALLGLIQWVRRKRLLLVDRSIRLLGVLYAAMAALYLFFEQVVINFRPVLINGAAEASYPSSTTLLVLCVMPTAALELRGRIKRPRLRRLVPGSITGFTLFMVTVRLISGVHWFSDIIGGVLLSGGLVLLYRSFLHWDNPPRSA